MPNDSASAACRVALLANPNKPEALVALDELKPFAESRCELVSAEANCDVSGVRAAKPDRIILLGGDGTLIGVARDLGDDAIPIVGVNAGKLGFLAEFTVDELKASFDQVLCDSSLIMPRTALDVSIVRGGKTVSRYRAINDCVVLAGPPFRIITLDVSINDQSLTEFGGDGVIVSTPTGSTAYNLSAGGPIMLASVQATIITPLNPHSLTHKPLVVEHTAEVKIDAREVNEGTTAMIDGQVSCPIEPGDIVVLKRAEQDVLVVRNPAYAKWSKLVNKLHWGRLPNYD